MPKITFDNNSLTADRVVSVPDTTGTLAVVGGTAPTNGQALIWSGSNARWQAGAVELGSRVIDGFYPSWAQVTQAPTDSGQITLVANLDRGRLKIDSAVEFLTYSGWTLLSNHASVVAQGFSVIVQLVAIKNASGVEIIGVPGSYGPAPSAPSTAQIVAALPAGTVDWVRVGSVRLTRGSDVVDQPATPATLSTQTGGPNVFSDGQTIDLAVNGTTYNLTVSGTGGSRTAALEPTGAFPLSGTLNIYYVKSSISSVYINNAADLNDVIAQINSSFGAGTASIVEGKLKITSQQQGYGATPSVSGAWWDSVDLAQALGFRPYASMPEDPVDAVVYGTGQFWLLDQVYTDQLLSAIVYSYGVPNVSYSVEYFSWPYTYRLQTTATGGSQSLQFLSSSTAPVGSLFGFGLVTGTDQTMRGEVSYLFDPAAGTF
jgi:hypothetical protein